VTDQLAEAGYIAIAPDLLSGSAPGGGGTAELGGGDAVRKAFRRCRPTRSRPTSTPWPAMSRKLPASNGKVVVGGFCWGGSQTFRFATNNKEIKAAFVFYGSGPDKESDLARITAPVYGFYGGNDARVNASVPKQPRRRKKAGKAYEPVTYEGAGHGFMRAGEAPGAKAADKKARDDSWKRWKELLNRI